MLPFELFVESVLRLLAATVGGMVIGLNRDLNGKEMGVRTQGLVGLGTALAALTATHITELAGNPDAMSRVLQGAIQGVLTGIGFLGGGVILRDLANQRVENLTTAASVWVTAAFGLACAIGPWEIAAIAVMLALGLLVSAGPLERLMDGAVSKEENR